MLTGVTEENSIFRQELVRPGRHGGSAADEDEAIALADDTPFGLGSYVFTSDADQATRVADRLEAGMVFINGVGLEAAELPFGGIERYRVRSGARHPRHRGVRQQETHPHRLKRLRFRQCPTREFIRASQFQIMGSTHVAHSNCFDDRSVHTR